jgi:hypothetical protein
MIKNKGAVKTDGFFVFKNYKITIKKLLYACSSMILIDKNGF